MKSSLVAGLSHTNRYDVDATRTIGFFGDENRVYSTPALLYDVEVTCRELLLQHSDAGEDSVGTRVEIDHMAPTLLGAWAEITVTLTAVKGRAVTFEFTAKDPVENIAKGVHQRFVVDVAQTVGRLAGKARATNGAA